MKVYADHAATTPMRERAKAAMIECLEGYGNPSSIHTAGRLAAMKLESARKEVAELLNCRPAEIYFTSGGTEADNWAIRAARYGAGRVVTSAFEHHAVLHTLEAMEREGTRKITRINPEPDGILDPEKVAAEADGTTNLVSVMAANNEIGALQPIAEISRAIKKSSRSLMVFHTDAVQAVGHIPVDVRDLGVDMLSASAHKFGGPKGVGFLYIRSGAELSAFMDGGGQEAGRRAGTENIAAIAGMAAALEASVLRMEENRVHLESLTERFRRRLAASGLDAVLNGAENRIPGSISASFRRAEGEMLLHRLDLKGIAVSTGSACNARSTELSHVLRAIRVPEEYAGGTIRLTFGPENTAEEVDYIVNCLREIIGG